MKHFLFLAALLCIGFTACDDDDTDGNKLPDTAKIWINGVDRANKALTSDEGTVGAQRLMTVAEICRTDSLCMYIGNVSNTKFDDAHYTISFFINPESEWDGTIDTVNNRLSMIAGNLNLVENDPFLSSDNRVFIFRFLSDGTHGDTVAYVPTSQRVATYEILEPMLADKAGNLDKIYKIFNDAFIFYPTTGAEYQRMLDEGVE